VTWYLIGRKLLRRSHASRRGNRFCRDLSVEPAGLSISADLRRALALSKRFRALRDLRGFV